MPVRVKTLKDRALSSARVLVGLHHRGKQIWDISGELNRERIQEPLCN